MAVPGVSPAGWGQAAAAAPALGWPRQRGPVLLSSSQCSTSPIMPTPGAPSPSPRSTGTNTLPQMLQPKPLHRAGAAGGPQGARSASPLCCLQPPPGFVSFFLSADTQLHLQSRNNSAEPPEPKLYIPRAQSARVAPHQQLSKTTALRSAPTEPGFRLQKGAQHRAPGLAGRFTHPSGFSPQPCIQASQPHKLQNFTQPHLSSSQTTPLLPRAQQPPIPHRPIPRPLAAVTQICSRRI